MEKCPLLVALMKVSKNARVTTLAADRGGHGAHVIVDLTQPRSSQLFLQCTHTLGYLSPLQFHLKRVIINALPCLIYLIVRTVLSMSNCSTIFPSCVVVLQFSSDLHEPFGFDVPFP